jgi:starch phosphorylase
MAQLTPRFSASRAVREYTERYYLPANERYRKRAADNGAVGKTIVDWRRNLEQYWDGLRFGEVRVAAQGEQHLFEAPIFLHDLSPEAVRVELYADSNDHAAAEHQEMRIVGEAAGPLDCSVYSASVSASRPATDYSVRLTPCCEGVAIPLECASILWQR